MLMNIEKEVGVKKEEVEELKAQILKQKKKMESAKADKKMIAEKMRIKERELTEKIE